jgi:hypothetical protein
MEEQGSCRGPNIGLQDDTIIFMLCMRSKLLHGAIFDLRFLLNLAGVEVQ